MTWEIKRWKPKGAGARMQDPGRPLAREFRITSSQNPAAAEAANGVLERIDSFTAELKAKKGVAQQKAIGYSEGVMPEDAVAQVKAIVDVLASAYSRHGPSSNELKQAYDALDRLIHDMLPFSGLKGAPFVELKRYAYYKLDEPLLVTGFKKLTGEVETLTASVRFFMDINADLQKFKLELSSPTTHLTEQEAVERVKSFVDRLAIGARKFGAEDANVLNANSTVSGFVINVMPSFGLSAQGLEQIRAYVAEKMDPARLK